MLKLWRHYFLSVLRGANLGWDVLKLVFSAIFLVQLLIALLLFSFFLEEIALELFPQIEPQHTGLAILLLYLLFDFVLRYFLEKAPVSHIQHYFHLNISKASLLRFAMSRSLVSGLNLALLSLYIPQFFTTLFPAKILVLGLLAFVFINSYLNFILKKLSGNNPMVAVLHVGFPFLVLAIASAFPQKFIALAAFLVKHPYLFTLFSCAMAVLIGRLVFRVLRRNAYIEEKQRKSAGLAGNFQFLNRFGELGAFIALDLKLIFRNKRPRTLILLSPLTMVYFIYLGLDALDKRPIFLALLFPLLLSAAAMNYGQFLFAWESSFMDYIKTRYLNIRGYLFSKWIFLNALCIIPAVIFLPPLAFIKPEVIPTLIACLLYCTGLINPGLIFFACYNAKRIDLGKGTFMNYEGMSGNQFLALIPVLFFPLIFGFTFAYFDLDYLYGVFLALCGLPGLILYKPILGLLEKQWKKRHYPMALGLRKKS
ncbi:MAG: DUF5687 family protein [Luteibaculum sp.]